MKVSDWEKLSTRTKQISLMDAYNMSEEAAEKKLREWGDWKNDGCRERV